MKTVVKLPIGIEDFKEIRTEGFYYVDKTGMITELLGNWSKVNLFTRPRRFGKSLNMNMLKYFFSYDCDPRLFDGLAIAKEKELCEKYMGKYPVISVTLKDVSAGNFEDAVSMLCAVIGREALRFRFLLESEKLSKEDKEQYARMIRIGSPQEPMFPMEKNVLANSLRTLSDLLCKHFGQKVILLIDEYDVPLDKANQCGYYDGWRTLSCLLKAPSLWSVQTAGPSGRLPGSAGGSSLAGLPHIRSDCRSYRPPGGRE